MEKKIIIAIIVFLLIVSIIGGVLVFKNANSSTGTEWGDRYFERLKEDIAKENSDYSNIDDNSMEITFIKLKENSTPSMMVTYKEADKKKINIYRERKYNNEDNQYIINNGMTNEENKEYDIQFLYNTELKENRWYVTTTETNSKIIDYTDIQKDFDRADKKDNFNNITESEEEINKNSSYGFNKDEMQQNQEISKFEETFIKIDDELVEKLYPSFTITTDMEETEIKNKMKENIAQYNPTNEEISNEIKIATENKITELENKKEQIKLAEEEKAKKEAEEKAKAEEEARLKAEEEAKKELKVGKYTLKYGKYTGTSYDEGTGGFDSGVVPTYTTTYTLKPDGTYTYSSTIGDSASGTYKVINLSSMGSYYNGQYGIEFSDGAKLGVPSNNTLQVLAGATEKFTYQGD